MHAKKLIPAIAIPGVAFAMAAGPVSAASAAPATPVAKPAAQADDITTKARAGAKCKTPKGKRINVSWSPGGSSTTVYFNNHCKQKRAIQTWRKDGSGWTGKGRCLTVNPKTKGKKKIWDPGFPIYKVTFPKKC